MSDDYVTERARRCLKANAVPSVFSWSAAVCQRTTNTSKKAVQQCDVEIEEYIWQ